MLRLAKWKGKKLSMVELLLDAIEEELILCISFSKEAFNREKKKYVRV